MNPKALSSTFEEESGVPKGLLGVHVIFLWRGKESKHSTEIVDRGKRKKKERLALINSEAGKLLEEKKIPAVRIFLHDKVREREVLKDKVS